METINAINKRTSVRFYKPNQITKEELETILHAGKRAPIGKAKYDEMHITVIQNKEFLENLTKDFQTYNNNNKIKAFHGSPTGIIISGKQTNYAHMEYDNAACIIENMIIAATDLNLGTVYLKNLIPFLQDNKKYLKKLNIKKDFIPLAALAIGYPDEKYLREPKQHEIEVNYI